MSSDDSCDVNYRPVDLSVEGGLHHQGTLTNTLHDDGYGCGGVAMAELGDTQQLPDDGKSRSRTSTDSTFTTTCHRSFVTF